MHIYIPPAVRNDLRAFTTHVNTLGKGSIIKFRTFRLIFGVKSTIVPIEELKLISVPARIQAFEKNVEWDSKSIRSRTLFGGKKAWYLQPGLGGQEMDVFWRRIGMNESTIKLMREQAIARMNEMARKKVANMKNAMKRYKGEKPGGKEIKEISLK